MKKVLLDSIWEEEEDYDAERDREEFLTSVMFSEVVSHIVSPASFDSNTMLMAHQRQRYLDPMRTIREFVNLHWPGCMILVTESHSVSALLWWSAWWIGVGEWSLLSWLCFRLVYWTLSAIVSLRMRQHFQTGDRGVRCPPDPQKHNQSKELDE